MTVEQMENQLHNAFPESDILVQDLTGTQDHYEVRIISPAFHGLSRIQQHQAVMKVFAPQLASGEVHALSLKTFAR